MFRQRKAAALGVPFWLAAVACLGAGAAPPAGAQVFSADTVKAEFLFRFAAYVEWPAEVAARESFSIGVIGSESVAAELRQLLPALAVGERKVRVLTEVSEPELDTIDILYAGSESVTAARSLLAATSARPILLVTDKANGLDTGSVINFVPSGRNIRFEISLGAAEQRRLRLNSALLATALRVVRGKKEDDT